MEGDEEPVQTTCIKGFVIRCSRSSAAADLFYLVSSEWGFTHSRSLLNIPSKSS